MLESIKIDIIYQCDTFIDMFYIHLNLCSTLSLIVYNLKDHQKKCLYGEIFQIEVNEGTPLLIPLMMINYISLHVCQI